MLKYSATLQEGTRRLVQEQGQRTFGLTGGRFVLNLLALLGVVPLFYGAWSAQNSALSICSGVALALVWLYLIALPMTVRVEILSASLKYRSLTGSKQIEFCDVVGVHVGFVKMFKILTIQTGLKTLSITSQTMPQQDIDDLAELIFDRAESNGNTRLRRPLKQKKFVDFSNER